MVAVALVVITVKLWMIVVALVGCISSSNSCVGDFDCCDCYDGDNDGDVAYINMTVSGTKNVLQFTNIVAVKAVMQSGRKRQRDNGHCTKHLTNYLNIFVLCSGKFCTPTLIIKVFNFSFGNQYKVLSTFSS